MLGMEEELTRRNRAASSLPHRLLRAEARPTTTATTETEPPLTPPHTLLNQASLVQSPSQPSTPPLPTPTNTEIETLTTSLSTNSSSNTRPILLPPPSPPTAPALATEITNAKTPPPPANILSPLTPSQQLFLPPLLPLPPLIDGRNSRSSSSNEHR